MPKFYQNCVQLLKIYILMQLMFHDSHYGLRIM